MLNWKHEYGGSHLEYQKDVLRISLGYPAGLGQKRIGSVNTKGNGSLVLLSGKGIDRIYLSHKRVLHLRNNLAIYTQVVLEEIDK